MTSNIYEDGDIKVSGHRLHLFDTGYGFASLLELIHATPKKVTLQTRGILYKILMRINKNRKDTFAILIDSSNLAFFALYLQAFKQENKSITFYLRSPNFVVKKNCITLPVSGGLLHSSHNSRETLLKRFNSDKSNRKLIICDYLDVFDNGFQSDIILQVQKGVEIFVQNYASMKRRSLHFELQNIGATVVEEADLSAYINM